MVVYGNIGGKILLTVLYQVEGKESPMFSLLVRRSTLPRVKPVPILSVKRYYLQFLPSARVAVRYPHINLYCEHLMTKQVPKEDAICDITLLEENATLPLPIRINDHLPGLSLFTVAGGGLVGFVIGLWWYRDIRPRHNIEAEKKYNDFVNSL
jgi:hypothetical protein